MYFSAIFASLTSASNESLPKKLAVVADATNLNELKTKQEANKYKKDMSMASAKELSEKMKDFELIFHIDKDEVFDELEVIDDVKKENNIQISDIIWIIILGAAFVGLIILSKKFKKAN